MNARVNNDPKLCNLKCMIKAATTLEPIGYEPIDVKRLNPRSSKGAKLEALQQIYFAPIDALCDDGEKFELLMEFIKAHLFHHTSYFETSLEDSYTILEESELTENSRVIDPAWEPILKPVHAILLSLLEYREREDCPERVRQAISPEFVASLVPLMLTPMHQERQSLSSILIYAVRELKGRFTPLILEATAEYIHRLNERNMPLRGVPNFMTVMLAIHDSVLDGRSQSAFLHLIHSSLFPLYKHRHFYLIVRPYSSTLMFVLYKYYRKNDRFVDIGSEYFPAISK